MMRSLIDAAGGDLRTEEDDYIESLREDQAVEAILVAGISALGKFIGERMKTGTDINGGPEIDVRKVLSTDEGKADTAYILKMVDYLSIKALQLKALRDIPTVGPPQELKAMHGDKANVELAIMQPTEGETYH